MKDKNFKDLLTSIDQTRKMCKGGTMYELKLYPNECLRAKNEDVVKFDKGLRQIVNAMKDIMGEYIGLAAPQIGVNRNIIVLRLNKYYVMINPKVTSTDTNLYQSQEACLSIPNEEVLVKRPMRVEVTYQDIKGEAQRAVLVCPQATAFLHEYDHLQGKLIIDYKKKEEGKDEKK